jgi:hypothetical protein
MLVASALASSATRERAHHTTIRTGIAVFSRHPKGIARIATAGALNPPANAILAAVVGHTEVFAYHNSSGEDCLDHLKIGAAGGGGCAPALLIEERGSVGVFQEGEGATAPGSPATLGVAAMVPNGVSSVRFTDRDGASYEVPVTNNVVEHEDVNLASVSFTMPGGAVETTDVAAIVATTPRQPGPAGSSK